MRYATSAASDEACPSAEATHGYRGRRVANSGEDRLPGAVSAEEAGAPKHTQQETSLAWSRHYLEDLSIEGYDIMSSDSLSFQ